MDKQQKNDIARNEYEAEIAMSEQDRLMDEASSNPAIRGDYGRRESDPRAPAEVAEYAAMQEHQPTSEILEAAKSLAVAAAQVSALKTENARLRATIREHAGAICAIVVEAEMDTWKEDNWAIIEHARILLKILE